MDQPTPTFAQAMREQDVLMLRDQEIARLRTELEAAKVNEARYLWLRDADSAVWCPYNLRGLTAVESDVAIDAERART